MSAINIHDAKTHLSRLLEDVADGKEFVIAKAGKPIAKLGPLGSGQPIRFGALKGKITVPDDFDAPLPNDVLASFAGGR